MSWFKKPQKKPNVIDQLANSNFKCSGCGEHHQGIFDLAYSAPDPWPDKSPTIAPNSEILNDGDILTEDFCRLSGNYMVRCTLPMTIEGSDHEFSFGVWGSLSEENFQEYQDAFDSRDQSQCGPYFSWLVNLLPGADSQPAKCSMFPQKDGKRPVLLLEDESHPFYQPQNSTLPLETLLNLYQRFGHCVPN